MADSTYWNLSAILTSGQQRYGIIISDTTSMLWNWLKLQKYEGIMQEQANSE